MQRRISKMGINELIIQDGIVEINWGIIQNGWELERIVIPESCMAIDKNAFVECVNLKEIIVSKLNTGFTSVDGVLFSKDMKRIIKYPPAKECNSYEIPDSVEVIERCAFCDCVKLRQVSIPESVLRINTYAFTGCTKLRCIDIHKKMEIIEKDAFYGCVGLNIFKMHPECRAKVIEPKDINSTSLYNDYCGMLLSCNNLKCLFLEDKSTKPVENLKWILSAPARSRGQYLSGSATKISNPFYNHLMIIARKVPIQKVPSDEKIAYVRGFVAYADEYPNIIAKGYLDYLRKTIRKWIPVFVKDTAFLSFMLHNDLIKKTQVDEVMEEVQKTGDAERITMMMNHIREKYGMGFDAYDKRTDAKNKEEEKKTRQKEKYEKKKIELEKMKKDPSADLKAVWRIERYEKSKTCKLSNYKGSAAKIILPDTYEGYKITEIYRSKALKNKGYDTLKSIVLPDSIERIGENAFSRCQLLENIVFPRSVEIIGEKAFFDCLQLKSLTIPDSVRCIKENAFENCRDLESIELGEGLEYIAQYAFKGCEKLKEITLPEGVSSVSTGMFRDCKNLEKVIFKNRNEINFYNNNRFIIGAPKAIIYVYKDTVLSGCPLKANRIKYIDEE